MTIVVREADTVSDRRMVVDLVRRHLTAEADEARHDWLYRGNPDGEGRLWLAEDDGTGQAVGMASAHPRLVQVKDRRLLAWNLGEFTIDPAHRSLGPALSLQRACLASVFDGRIPFCYDHPNRAFMALYRRMGIEPAGALVRYLKPLRVDRKLRRLLRSRLVASVPAALANTLLRLRDLGVRRTRRYRVQAHTAPFGEEFSDLNERVIGRFPVCGVRSAGYLEWRYRANPLYRYEVLTARQGSRLAGYVVFACHREDAHVADLFGEEIPDLARDLLPAVISEARRRRMTTLNAAVTPESSLVPALRRAGFMRFDETPLVVCTRAGGALEGVVTDGRNWFMTQGDRDT